MQPHHLFLLHVILAVVACIFTGLSFLLRRGLQSARMHVPRPNEGGIVRWKESMNSARSGMALARRILRRLAWRGQMAGRVPVSESIIADPVDGTVFQEGEIIIRCVCGTSYHQCSWQWLGEKNEGKCVNCRRPGLISTCSVSQSRSNS